MIILEWLDNPHYSSTSDNDPHLRPLPVCQSPPSPTYAKVSSLSHFHPPRCLLTHLMSTQRKRPLFAYGSDQEDSEMGRALPIEPFVPVCNIDNVRDQLQKAVQLEFYTLPRALPDSSLFHYGTLQCRDIPPYQEYCNARNASLHSSS